MNKVKDGFPIVALGASAGGLEAFERFLKAAAEDLGCAFILISHLDPTHTSLLPELLQKYTRMPVVQITDATVVVPNHVYIIPPNKNLSILNGVLQLMEITRSRGINLPIDSFFRSLAKDQGSNAICIVLSGTGTDGTLGLKAIKAEVGMVMAQSEDSAKYDGMPRSAINTGLVDYILAPDKMPEQLIAYNKYAYKNPKNTIQSKNGEQAPNILQKIFIILRAQTGHDFSQYKKNTIFRRIERRMNIHQIEDVADYLRYLQNSSREVDILFKELLIGVTNFFRDIPAFDFLKSDVLPELLAKKPDDYTVRVWVTGCSSGEETYSLAIILKECIELMKKPLNVQIFGTDIDEEAISIARTGIYSDNIQNDVSSERLQRYFIKEGDSQYRICKSIREMVVFATQNVIKDPPFTKLDIISCRNLLIYFGPELQKKLFPIFHYSLKPDGVLFLGSSETIGRYTDLFKILDKKWKIFRRKSTRERSHPMMSFQSSPMVFEKDESQEPNNIQKVDERGLLQLVETILRGSNTPPSAIIDDASNVIYIHGSTGHFLEPAEGRASMNIINMAKPGLKAALSIAIRKVSMHKQEVVHKELQIENSKDDTLFDLTVRPVHENDFMRGMMMVIFNETSKLPSANEDELTTKTKKKGNKSNEELKRELEYTKENLQTTIEELETSNEELKSTNEELQSTNEELQSTNEEMETSKEELQSLNEESGTVNAELQSRIDELSRANDDLKNLLDSTDSATLFLDINLSIRRFTPTIIEIMPLSNTDIGRPLAHFSNKLIKENINKSAYEVLQDLNVRERQVSNQNGIIYNMKVRPYRTASNLIDGVIITFDDITERLKANKERQEAEIRSHSYFDLGLIGMAVISPDKNWIEVNDKLCQMMGYSRKELSKLTWAEITHPKDLQKEEAEFQLMLKGDKEGYALNKRFICKKEDSINTAVSVKCIRNEDKSIKHFVAMIQEITNNK